MPATDSHLSSLSYDDREVLESWLVDFDLTWNEDRLRAWVRRLPSEKKLRRAALIELVKIDLERRWQQGKKPRLESYLKALPELGTPDALPIDLLLAEYEARRYSGAGADTAELAQRFPIQAEELRRHVEQSRAEDAKRSRQASLETPRLVNQRTGAPPESSASRPAALPPEQLGRYQIVRELGRGAMGAVYLARDSQLDRLVALKVPRFTAAEGVEVRQRFLSEGRAAATIEHPYICPVYDVGEIDGTPYLTMAYVEGTTLAQRLEHGTALPEQQAVALVRLLAGALQAAHERGIIHRDLKPSNIILNRRGEPVILDFGLARRMHVADARLTQCGQPLGTPAYMAPEQATGAVEAVGPGCDVYALGVILYQMLTGRLPFEGSVTEVLGQIVSRPPEPPSNFQPGLDRRLESICLKALNKRVIDRFADMRAFGTALEGYAKDKLRQSASNSTNVLSDSSLTGWVRRKKSWLLVVGGAAATLAAFLGFIMMRSPANVRIDLEGAQTEVVIQLDGEQVDRDALNQPLRLKPGPHHLLITGSQIQPVSKSFTVSRGDNLPVVIALVASPAAGDPSPPTRRRHKDDDDDDDEHKDDHHRRDNERRRIVDDD
jgi:serine/threonine protein kinase